MSTVGKELHLFLVDVGPDMHPYLEEAGRNLFNLATSRFLNKPALEMALIFFGTADTSNELNREFEAQGDPGQYTNIVTAQELQCTSLDTLRALQRLPRGPGPSDWVNALLLAIDLMTKADQKFKKDKYPRRIFLLSTFTQPCDLDADTRAAIVGGLQQRALSLEVKAFGDYAAAAPEVAAVRDDNLDAIMQILAAAPGEIRMVPGPGDAAGMFQAVYKDGNANYTGPFSLIDQHINVKVYKKTNPEMVSYNASSWELKRYIKPKPGQPEDNCWVEFDRERRLETDLDAHAVTTGDTVPAYKYGRQNVPVTQEDEEHLSYTPDKALQLLGFVPLDGPDAVPRYYLGCGKSSKGCFVLLGEKEGDALAISALARAMARDKRAAVVRWVQRAKTAPGLYLLTPHLAAAAGEARSGSKEHDCLVMNRLPFCGDFRPVVLPSFEHNPERPELTPSREQFKSMAELVKQLDLSRAGPSGGEALRPEEVVDPTQQRLYQLLGRRMLDTGYRFPETEGEALSRAVCDPPLDVFPKAGLAAGRRLAELFKTQAPKPKGGDAAGADAAAVAPAAAAAAAGAGGDSGGAAAAGTGADAARQGVVKLGESAAAPGEGGAKPIGSDEAPAIQPAEAAAFGRRAAPARGSGAATGGT